MLKVTVPRMTTEARELLVKQARTLGKHGLTLILALALALARSLTRRASWARPARQLCAMCARRR